jgi:hypothetical protein
MANITSMSRIQAAIGSIRAALIKYPETRQNTANLFANDGEENAMTARGSSMIRVPDSLNDRADALLEKMEAAQAPELGAANRASRAAIFRLALAVGIEKLEKKYASKNE